MVNSLLPIDNFVVVNKTVLNDQDRLILTIFYQPIIGSISVSLYLTLFSFLDKNKIVSKNTTHKDLINAMQIKLEDIKEAKDKLEAIGLLKTYFKKGNINNYVYELYGPLSVHDFINNPMLNTALYNNLNKDEYQRIVDMFTLPNISLKGYKDVSCTFKDVFGFFSTNKMVSNNIKKINHLGLVFEPTINFNEVLSLIPDDLLRTRSITKSDKETIYAYAYIYNLDNNMIKDIILNSIDNRTINFDKFKENCRNYYIFENKGEIPKIVYKNQPLGLRQEVIKNTKKSKLINQFETVSPYEFLMLKQDSKPSKKDMEIVEYLMIEQKLNPGVVNVLIDYVLKINNNKLVRNFVEQIAVQWKRSKIETVSDAIDMAISEYDNKKKKKVVVKKVETVPNWVDKDINDDILSEEELKQLERELKND